MDYTQKETYSFPQTVFKQIQIIQEICKKELRDGDKIIKNLVGEQMIEGEDTRYSYLQSVDLLGSLLSPYFNSDLKKDYDKFVETYQMELKEALEDEDFKKEVCAYFGYAENSIITQIQEEAKKSEKGQINIYFLNEKIKFARIIFRELIQCFKNNDFLAQESYGDKVSGENNMEATEEEDDEEKLEEIDE